MKYSITSVALPDLDLLGQAKLLSSLGYDGLELRVRRNPEDTGTGPSFWGQHRNDVSPENLVSRAAEIRQVLDEYGLALAGLASYVNCTDLDEFKLVLEGAVAVGAKAMRVSGAAPFTKKGNDNYQAIFGDTVAGYARCIEAAQGSGVKLLLETHGGTIHTSASLGLRIVSNFSPSQAGLIFDPNNMVSDGFETTGVVIPMLGEYIGHCHIAGHRPYPGEKDENGTVTWKWECCSMAEGLYDFPEMLRWLKKIDYQGFISVEDYRAELSSEYRCKEAIHYLKKIE